MIRNEFPIGALIDLHLHLDGSLSFESARELAAMQDMPALDDWQLRQRLVAGSECHDLQFFLTKFYYPDELLQSEAAITKAVRNLLTELREDGLIYAEIRFAPSFHLAGGLSIEQVVRAAIAGLDDSILPARLILCCIRFDFAKFEEYNRETARMAIKYHGKGVVALDLACDDGTYAIKPYAEFLNMAREAGVPLSVHAGENANSGTWSIKDALELGVSRIDHGVQAYQDSELMERLARSGMHLTLCPSSYVCTGTFADISSVPYRDFMDAGVRICLNTDNITTVGTTVREEFRRIRNAFGMTQAQAAWLLHNAVDASFAEPELKAELHAKVADFYHA